MYYHSFDPNILQIGPLTIRWYGVCYLLGFFVAWLLGRKRAIVLGWESEQIADLIFYSAWGVILGGRIGYWLFYDLAGLIDDPLELFILWHGGMSFHGGLIGVAFSIYLFNKKYAKGYHNIADFLAPLVPPALGFGRIANFINGELLGRVTDVPWAVIFPYAGDVPRHPSQLYEAILEGLILFIVIWIYSRKKRAPWNVTALFIAGYGIARFVTEFYREPDQHLGFILFGWMTQGQLLSMPMILMGIGFLTWRKISNNIFNTKKMGV